MKGLRVLTGHLTQLLIQYLSFLCNISPKPVLKYSNWKRSHHFPSLMRTPGFWLLPPCSLYTTEQTHARRLYATWADSLRKLVGFGELRRFCILRRPLAEMEPAPHDFFCSLNKTKPLGVSRPGYSSTSIMFHLWVHGHLKPKISEAELISLLYQNLLLLLRVWLSLHLDVKDRIRSSWLFSVLHSYFLN